jgi:prepilin-type N-terminal cleavage/methylation domain-containing protein
MNIKAKTAIKKTGYSRGFTVLELVVSMAIIAIMAAIAVPNYLSYIPKARVNGVTRMVMADLMAARMKAVSSKTRTKVFFISNYEYKICNDANDDGTVDNGEGDVVLKDIRSEYPDVRLYFTGDPIFLPRGTATNDHSATLTWIVSYNNRSYKVVAVSVTGRIKVDYSYSYDA